MFQRDAEWRWYCPVVGLFEFSTLWVEGFSPRMVPGYKCEMILGEIFRGVTA